jgi:hypothetical protein
MRSLSDRRDPATPVHATGDSTLNLMTKIDGTFIAKQAEKVPAGNYNVCSLATSPEDGKKREDIDFTVPNRMMQLVLEND